METNLAEMFGFLDRLRMSARISMFNAPSALAKSYDLDIRIAQKVWSAWCSTFNREQPPNLRAARYLASTQRKH